MTLPDIENRTPKDLENLLLQAHIRQNTHFVDALLAQEFVEFTSTGEIIDKKQVLNALKQEQPYQRSMHNVNVVNLTPDCVLITYSACKQGLDLKDAPQYSLRSSLWKQTLGSWQMVFHQGTRCIGFINP